MKKRTRLFLVLAAVGVVAALSVPVVNLLVGGPKGTAVTSGAPERGDLRAVAKILERSCANCHSHDTRMPWYASLPFASSLIEKDIERGRRYFDLPEGLYPGEGAPPTEPTLARIEWGLEQGTMPPSPYKHAHPESSLEQGERDKIRQWARETRLTHYAPAGLAEGVAAAPVQPLAKTVRVDQRRADLGETLYFDKRLSGDETIACATCHDLTKGGTDQDRVSTGIRGQQGGINAPTTFNASYHIAQFWDRRAATLEEQAGGPPLNPIEMGSSWNQILGRLRADAAIAARFAEAYPGPDPVTAEHVTGAIAEYERTLVTPDAPFDRYLLGDVDALPREARRGWELFQEHACHLCHVGRNLGGRSYELMGRARDYFAQRRGERTDADLGRFAVTKAKADRHRFKVPGLRNVTATFPYFHDGSARDLASATRTMARVQLDWEPTREETRSLVAFLESLTGTFQGRPLAEAPRDARTFAAPAAPPPPDGGTAPAPATQQ